jgi:hypothetical protein
MAPEPRREVSPDLRHDPGLPLPGGKHHDGATPTRSSEPRTVSPVLQRRSHDEIRFRNGGLIIVPQGVVAFHQKLA